VYWYRIGPSHTWRDPLPAFASMETGTEPDPVSLAALAARYGPCVANGPGDGPDEWDLRFWQEEERVLVRVIYRGPAPAP